MAREVCLRLLGVAPRTRADLAAALTRQGIADEVAEAVLSRFAEAGIIDDALFAEMWVTSRHRGRGLAGRALGHELRRRGVDEALVQAAVDELAPEDELATARDLIARRLPATRGQAPEVRLRRLAGLLARKGYPAGTAYAVVREALADDGQKVDLPLEAEQAQD